MRAARAIVDGGHRSSRRIGAAPRRYPGAGPVPPLIFDDQLIEAGLAFIDVVNLMLAVEPEFDVMIPAFEITPAKFRSISTIEGVNRQDQSDGHCRRALR